MAEEGLGGVGHGIGDVFEVGSIRVKVTPADHAWQNEVPVKANISTCGRTRAGSGWRPRTGRSGAPGDSRLVPGASPAHAYPGM